MWQVEPTLKPYVVNLNNNPAPPYVYVGRAVPRKGVNGSPWGNPWTIGKDGNRSAVLYLYERWLLGNPDLMARLPELRGKVLACWCAPLPCHADILLRLANR